MRYIRDMNESLRLRIDVTKLSAHYAQALGLHRKKSRILPLIVYFFARCAQISCLAGFLLVKEITSIASGDSEQDKRVETLCSVLQHSGKRAINRAATNTCKYRSGATPSLRQLREGRDFMRSTVIGTALWQRVQIAQEALTPV